MIVSVLNMALRGVTMAGRFVLLLALASYLPAGDVGLFALFTSANLWGVYLQGLEFHLFNVREIVAHDPALWARRTRDAFALYATSFSAATLLWLGIFRGGLLPWWMTAWFLGILALEHAAQEIYRLLNVFGRPLAGSIVLFARSGSWMYVVAAVMWRAPSVRSLETVFAGWLAGAGSAVILGIVFLGRLPWRGLPRVEWTWIRGGLRVSTALLLGSLALRGIPLFERWFVGYSGGRDELGVFGFYATICGAIPVLADSGIGAVLYPKMMKAWKQGDLTVYKHELGRLWLSFIAFTVLAIGGALGVVTVAVHHLHNKAYASALPVFGVLLAAAAVWTLATVPQYAMWARSQDRAMIGISIIGFVVAVVAAIALVPVLGALGAAVTDLTAVVAICVLRLAALGRVAAKLS